VSDSFFSFVYLFANDKLLIAYDEFLTDSSRIFRISMLRACLYSKLSRLIIHDLLLSFLETCKSNLLRMLLSCMTRSICT